MNTLIKSKLPGYYFNVSYSLHLVHLLIKLDKLNFYAAMYGSYNAKIWKDDANDMYLMGGEL